MSNASNLSTLANVLDDGSDGQFLKSTGSGGVAFDTVAAGAVVYATADLLPLSGFAAGDMAYVTATNRFYINNGSGWYSVSLVNTNPSITSVQDASSGTTPFTLATDQTATVITITAADPEGVPLTYGYSVTTGSLTNGGGTTATVAQGTGATYAIADASLLSGTHTVNANVGALTFKPDGTEMYYVGTNNDRVNRHTLSTAWDVSTASFVGSSPNTLSQVSSLTDVKFNNNGTKMYMADKAGTTDNTIYQYSLSTAWDPDTATYDNKSYDFSSVLTGDDLNCFVFNADGTAVYLAEHSPSSNIYQFTLSTAFDISTASYANKTLSLSSVASNGSVGRQYFQFTNDGSKLFLIHTFHPSGFVGKIYEYSLTTAYDISTASHTSVTYTPTGITNSRSAIAFKPDGTKMFIMGTDNHTTISQYNLPIYTTNDFIVTPTTTEAYAGNFTLTFTASDGINQATSANAFQLAFAADWANLSQTQMLQPTSQTSADQFGRHLVLKGGELFVGAFAAGVAGNYQGRLYVFTKSGSTWSQSQVLVSSDIANYDQFGFNVDVDGDYLLISAKELSNPPTGGGYIFHKSGNTWSQQAKLVASTAAAYDSTGESCAISGDTAVLGSPWGEPPGSSINAAGEAFVFVRSGTSWSEQARINPTNTANDYLDDVDIDGDTIVIGSTQNLSSTNGGAVYVYTRSGTSWSLQQKIISNNAAVANSRWGEQVKISGDTLVASCANYTNGSGHTGNVEVWTRSGTSWSFQATLTPNPTDTSGSYGRSLSIDGDTVAVGNYSYSGTAGNEGRAYIFERTGTSWSQKKVLTASTPVGSSNFGYGVSVDEANGEVAIGASSFSASPTARAYVFNA